MAGACRGSMCAKGMPAGAPLQLDGALAATKQAVAATLAAAAALAAAGCGGNSQCVQMLEGGVSSTGARPTAGEPAQPRSVQRTSGRVQQQPRCSPGSCSTHQRLQLVKLCPDPLSLQQQLQAEANEYYCGQQHLAKGRWAGRCRQCINRQASTAALAIQWLRLEATVERACLPLCWHDCHRFAANGGSSQAPMAAAAAPRHRTPHAAPPS